VPEPEVVDATRRTRLANERTYLAWWRTGLTALAVAFGAGKIVPALTEGPQWPYTVVGAGFAVVGIALVAYGQVRRQRVEEALDRGEFEPLPNAVSAVLAGAGVALGIAVLLVVLLES
jgi:putative membrane protein